MKSYFLSRWTCTFALAALTGLFSPNLSAQAGAGSAAQQTEETIELSPFTVNSDSDTGYAATETLAGTRMRTDLKDIGAALTIMTPEFMEDLGVNSFDQALLYTPSVDATEGDNTDQNRASGTQLRYGTGQSFSIRGFNTNSGEQAIAHDFFDALDTTDNYNLERITLSLGPNALLIGVGNPQGVAVTSTKRGRMDRNRTSLRTQADRWGSLRLSIDHNQVLIKDKLAARINLLYDEKREFRRYEGKDQMRGTISIAAKPLKNTTVTLNHESYDLHSNFSGLQYQFDGGLLRWAKAGKPTVDFVPTTQGWTTTRDYVDHLGNRIPVAPGVVDEDGFVDSQSDFDPNGALQQIGGNGFEYVVGLPGDPVVINRRRQGQLATNTFGGINSASYQQENPWDITGIAKDANLNGGTWDDPSSHEMGRWTQLLLEQKLADGLYLELAGNVAKHYRNFAPNTFLTITMDPNRYRPDGSLNPGYLQPFTDDNQSQYREVIQDLKQYRGTLSYELDLTEKSYWLGSHNFAGLYQETTRDNNEDLLRVFNLAAVGNGGNGWPNVSTNGAYLMSGTSYFIDGNVPILPDSLQIQKNMAYINSLGNSIGVSANEQQPIELGLRQFLGARKSRIKTDSKSFGWQARWFDNRLVTVFGYRQDDVASYVTDTPRDVADPIIPGSDTNAQLRYWTSGVGLPFNDDPLLESSGITRTYGAVFHALPWLSLTYNKSSNFLPVPNPTWVNALNEPAPNSQGNTQDYGVRFNLLKNRLSLSLIRFETSADDQSRNANADVGGARNNLGRLRTNYNVGTTVSGPDSHFQDMLEFQGYPVETGAVSDTWSYVAEGYEMRAVYNPSPNWRISLSASQNTNQQGTHLAALGRYLYDHDTKYEGLATWRNYASELRKVEAGQASSFFDLDPANEEHRLQAGVDALYLEEQTNALEINYQDDIALTGITTARNGKYAVNGLFAYTFDREARLKGWSIGGNFRWRSANTIGYERLADASGQPVGIIDVDKPVLGDDFYDIGAMLSYQRRLRNDWNLRVQLNVTNLFNINTPRLVTADYDTRAVYGIENALVNTRWELRRPRNFILTVSFEL